MRSLVRRAGALCLLAALAACADGGLATLPEPSARAASLDGIPSDGINEECTLIRIENGTGEGSWESTCPGISGGETLPPPPPPPQPAPTFPPPSEPTYPGGGGGTPEAGSSDGPSPLCLGAVGAVIGLKAEQMKAQEAYQAAYDAYIKAYNEYKAYDNQIRADGVVTYAEQMNLSMLGDRMRSAEATMLAAKATYDGITMNLYAAEGIAALVCVIA